MQFQCWVDEILGFIEKGANSHERWNLNSLNFNKTGVLP